MKTKYIADHLISITSADVSREGERVLHGISWRLGRGENWAVIGPNGSGKSTLLRLIRGDLWPEPKKSTRREYCFDGECQESALGIKKYIGLVTPELQDRYVRHGIDIAGEEVIFTGFFDSVWLQERPGPSMVKSARRLISLLDLDGLRKRSILKMSRGEARKVLIARALVSSPRVLLMDEVFNGLDADARKQVFGLLERTIQGGTQIVLATHRVTDIGPFITHAALLKEGRIFRRGSKDRVLTPDNLGSVLDLRKKGRVPMEDVVVPAGARGKTSVNERFLIKMRRVDVYIGERNVLRNVDWVMRAGENWAIIGENGAGKSTFLRLISGDLRPATGGEINWFGGRCCRSVWDLRKKIGYISPELQAEYDEDMTGEEVVRSGFFSSIGLYRRATSKQRRLSGELVSFLGLEKLCRKPIARMSYGEFRKVLIARALVKDPALLLLDEPFSGLDAPSKKDFAQFLGKISQGSVSVILVTHHRDEIISSISHVLVFDRGQIAAQGRKEDILKDGALSKTGLIYRG